MQSKTCRRPCSVLLTDSTFFARALQGLGTIVAMLDNGLASVVGMICSGQALLDFTARGR